MLLLLVSLHLCGCVQQMSDQPRLEPLEASDFFRDGRASRDLVVGTVPRGHHRDEIVEHSEHFLTGLVDGEVADELPAEVTEEKSLEEVFERGRERYEIFCSHCHDLVGTGRGMVPQRGYPEPPTYHSERLRASRIGHFFRVITDGRGRMPAHGKQIPAEDRWAIAAYIRVLQWSQHAPASALSEEDRRQLPEPQQ